MEVNSFKKFLAYYLKLLLSQRLFRKRRGMTNFCHPSVLLIMTFPKKADTCEID